MTEEEYMSVVFERQTSVEHILENLEFDRLDEVEGIIMGMIQIEPQSRKQVMSSIFKSHKEFIVPIKQLMQYLAEHLGTKRSPLEKKHEDWRMQYGNYKCRQDIMDKILEAKK